MQKLAILIVMLAGAGSAFADIPPGPPPPRPPAPPPAVEPKPDAALGALNVWVGAWKCEGKSTMDGVDKPFTSTAKVSWELGKFWLLERGESKTHHSVSYLGYKPGAKVYTMMYVDDGGDSGMETTAGPDANGKWVFAGKGTDLGADVDITDTYEYSKDGKSVHIHGSDPKASYDATCKK